MEDKQFALLIDSENISAKYISIILEELAKHGTATYKRIYGDWTNQQSGQWKEIILHKAIVPIQQYSYVAGKNATDAALIIDAMDTLYSNKVQGFCIVSSDSDFTRLVIRLREGGMSVIGMGEQKTPEAFRASFERFIYLDVIADIQEEAIQVPVKITKDKEKNKGIKPKDLISKKKIEDKIVEMINESNKKYMGMGEVGSRLVKSYSDFDVRNYGYTKLSKFIESLEMIELEITNNSQNVKLKEIEVSLEEIKREIYSIVKKHRKNGINLGQIKQELCIKIKGFNVKNYGYTKFINLIQDCPKIKIQDNNRATCKG